MRKKHIAPLAAAEELATCILSNARIADRLGVHIAVLELQGCFITRDFGSRQLEAFCKHMLTVIASGFAVLPLSRSMSGQELLVACAAVHRVLLSTYKSGLVFAGLLVMNPKVSLFLILDGVNAQLLPGGLSKRRIGEIVQYCMSLPGWPASLLVLLGCALAQAALLICRSSNNTRRKAFHFAILVHYLAVPRKLAVFQFLFALYGLSACRRVAACFGRQQKRRAEKYILIERFISEKDRKEVLSHIFLLCGCLFPLLVLGDRERPRAMFVLSSLGVVDSVASFFPRDRSRHKSLLGSIAGGLAAHSLLSFSGVHYPIRLFLFLGLVEYAAQMNDNILLPFLAYAVTGSPLPCSQ